MKSESIRNDRKYGKSIVLAFALKYIWLSKNSYDIKHIVHMQLFVGVCCFHIVGTYSILSGFLYAITNHWSNSNEFFIKIAMCVISARGTYVMKMYLKHRNLFDVVSNLGSKYGVGHLYKWCEGSTYFRIHSLSLCNKYYVPIVRCSAVCFFMCTYIYSILIFNAAVIWPFGPSMVCL